MKIKKTNSIEKKCDMNCINCTYLSKCVLAEEEKEHELINRICDCYANEEKGIYEDKRKKEKVCR